MAEAADETDAARALLHAKDFSNLAAMLVPDGVPSEFLIDELSFELVAPILTHHAAAPAATTRCMQALAAAANPREAYALLMEAFSTHPSAPCQLLVLGALPAVLRRITRKRSEFVAACLGSLSRRFVAAWPGQEWDDEAEDEGAPPPPPSRRLLDALVACVPTPAELAEGDRSRLRGDERLCVGFLLRLLAVAARHATPEAEAGVAEALDARTVSAAELGEAAAAAARASAEGAAAAADGDADDEALYERNARTLVTLWGPADSTLHEYSYRLWGGLVGSFYYPRWAKWFAAVDAALAAKVKFNESAFYSEIEAWEEAWTGRRDAFPTAPAGGALRKAREVFARHFR